MQDWQAKRDRAEAEDLKRMADHARGLGNRPLAEALARQIAKLERGSDE